MDNKKQSKSTVADVLAHYGRDVSYFRGGFFRSPFREEAAPSLHVSGDCRVWYDHGTAEGGGVIDLVMRLEGTSDRARALEVLRRIEGSERPVPVTEANRMVRADGASRLEVLSAGPFTTPGLVSYAISRGIPHEVLSRYCEEVSVSPAGTGRRFAYIGFRNASGGYVLRNSIPRHGKRCTGSFPTYISSVGEASGVPSCGTVAVFEGFFDFLSYIASGRARGTLDPAGLAPGCDVCVLNSVSNRDAAKGYVLAHGDVLLFLDNDRAGADTVRFFRDMASGAGHPVRVEDMSPLYRGSNDLNEHLVSHGPVSI